VLYDCGALTYQRASPRETRPLIPSHPPRIDGHGVVVVGAPSVVKLPQVQWIKFSDEDRSANAAHILPVENSPRAFLDEYQRISVRTRSFLNGDDVSP
jgi:hypothetical protein